MPCTDVTEQLQILLDADDRMVDYSLIKRTCGGTMGRDSLILKMVKSMRAEHIAACPPHVFYETITFSSDLKELVYLKHYRALRAALSEYLGWESDEPGADCRMENVQYDSDATRLTASVSLSLATERIPSCGACDTCRPKDGAANSEFPA
jgi:hypothetical protein